MTTKSKQLFSTVNHDHGSIHAFYVESTGSNDGSVLCNKTFQSAYSIIKYDFQQKKKRIIGILHNKFDNRTLYFQIFVPLNINFSIPFLLEYYIYSKTYNADIVKKIIMDDKDKKHVIDYCQYLLDQKIKGVKIDYKH